jgi:peptide/nickel transport system substrate-binding protein
MKKIFKGAIGLGLCCSMLLTACGGDGNSTTTSSGLNSETRQLQLATGALDGNFNPFFYTAQNDGNILSLTQIAMLTTDNDGNLVAGEDEACVVLDYTTTVASDNSQTEYQFLIKNDIKFSDGEDLTIKDVLFSLYVYLDPAYTGSATIYSTDIKGLKAYRAQDASVSDDSDTDFDATFAAEAQTRIYDLIDWSEDKSAGEVPSTEQMKSDLATVKELFLEEITSDWTSIEQSWQSTYEKTHRFTSTWEAYLYNEGLVTVQTKLNSNGSTSELYEDKNGNGTREDGELYYTTLDPDGGVEGEDIQGEEIIKEITAATTKEKVSAYMAENNCDEDYATEQLQKQCCINMVYDTYTDKTEIANVLSYWATASSALEEFTGEARTAWFKELKESGKGVDTVSGITTDSVTSFNGKTYSEAHDVLKIVINGVDPKAIYNFGFTVAPLHYYSGTYEGVDYVATADGKTKFGVDVGNKEFYDTVVQATDKNGLPVGAGPYQATNSKGEDKTSGKVTKTTFFENNIVYFMRNDNFTTVGTGISNAKIKYVNYKVLADDKIVDALTTQTIDFGMPNATPTNKKTVGDYKYLSSKDYYTGGYGYVGINPKYVPEVQVRQAIMKAMDTSYTIGYYGKDLAAQIYRPMSLTSWAYPKDSSGKAVGEYDAVAYTSDNSEITQLIADAGYTKNSKGIYVKTSNAKNGASNAKLGTTLKLTFTIAGESSDHPAYTMFTAARDRLNALGFDITVQTDIQALKKMSSGNLAVWAAAWSSSSDPDPYQIYHKDSNATSVNNWNYSNILNDSDSWSYEYNLINTLSSYIDQGRATLDQSTRKTIYAKCMDLIMDLAVELPTYQRSDLCVYNNTVIDKDTLVQNPSYTMGLFDKLWEIDYVK